jgi:hypothetical protein
MIAGEEARIRVKDLQNDNADPADLTAAEEEANLFRTLAQISLSDMNFKVADDLTDVLEPGDFFEWKDLLFQVDPSRPLTPDTVSFVRQVLGDSTSSIWSEYLADRSVDYIYLRSPVSSNITFTTEGASLPGSVSSPSLRFATGGSLHIELTSPKDTGGIPITNMDVYLNDERIEPIFYDLIELNDLQTTMIAQIGHLSPRTEYRVVYMALNDLSNCAANSTPSFQNNVFFQTTRPTIPSGISSMQQDSATGGGIHIKWDPPFDPGSDSVLFYQVYMSESNADTSSWNLVYNDTREHFWKTKLKSATPYYFKITCLNDVGYSDDSLANIGAYKFSTSSESTPGPVSRVQVLDASGGMIHFTWEAPDDDGGKSVMYYVIEGNNEMKIVDTTEIYFGGLIANTEYDFAVYAANVLGRSNVGVKARFSTGDVSIPTEPDAFEVVSASGGAATLEILVPADTGGVSVDDLTFKIYANGIPVSVDALAPLENSDTKRRLSILQDTSDLEFPTLDTVYQRLEESNSPKVYWMVGNLLPSTIYSFTLQSSNPVGESTSTDNVGGQTSPPTPPQTPNPPYLVAFSGGSLTIGWNIPVDSGGLPVTRYLLGLSTVEGEEVSICEGLILQCTIGDLDPLKEYLANVTAYNDVGASAHSDVVTFLTNVVGLPLEPQNVHISNVSNQAMRVEWGKPLDLGGSILEEYTVDVRLESDDTSAVSVLNISADEPKEIFVEGLTPNTSYYVTIVSISLRTVVLLSF